MKEAPKNCSLETREMNNFASLAIHKKSFVRKEVNICYEAYKSIEALAEHIDSIAYSFHKMKDKMNCQIHYENLFLFPILKNIYRKNQDDYLSQYQKL